MLMLLTLWYNECRHHEIASVDTIILRLSILLIVHYYDIATAEIPFSGRQSASWCAESALMIDCIRFAFPTDRCVSPRWLRMQPFSAHQSAGKRRTRAPGPRRRTTHGNRWSYHERNGSRAFPWNMPGRRVVGSLWRSLVDAPGVFVHKYNQLKRHRQPDSRDKVTENELHRLHGKIVSTRPTTTYLACINRRRSPVAPSHGISLPQVWRQAN